ncbi:hypothetical protein BJV78DRAFT_264843 [Lactifluus subvellereus]|nr:hypothetical protein BJV78DRAFT_264843 [Lactifluus subvellereus]
MSAAARAEARRKAILSRGTDRLSKLTASARGDDAPQLAQAGPPPPYSSPRGSLANFIGEDPLPVPPIPDQPSRRPPVPQASPFDSSGLASSPLGPSVWSNEQRHQFLQASLALHHPTNHTLLASMPQVHTALRPRTHSSLHI